MSRNESDSSLSPIEDESVDELTKLRMENEWLREVLIRATREDVVNLRESQEPFRIKSPRDSSTITSPLTTSNGVPVKRVSSTSLNLDSLNHQLQSSNTLDSNSNGPDESLTTSLSKAASRKSAKLTNAFIKKQSSTKIIQKIKSHKNLDPRKALEATGNLAPLTNTNDSKRPLNAINESSAPKSESTTDVKLPPLPAQPPTARSRRSLIKNDDSKSLALTSSCRNIVPPIGVLSPGKIGLSRQNTIGPSSWKKISEINSSAGADSTGNTTPLSSERTERSEGNKENLKESLHREGIHRENSHREGIHRESSHREGSHREGIHREGIHRESSHREKRRSFLNRDSSKVHDKDMSSLLDVIQKMVEMEQNIAPQKSEHEVRKQLEDVRHFVSSMVGSLTHLSHSQK